MRYLLFILLSSLIISACTTVPVVPDAQEEKVISAYSVNCKKPYQLVQGCSKLTGAKRRILLDEHEVKIAATEDGKVVYFIDANQFKNSMKDATELKIDYGTPTVTRSANAIHASIKSYLASKDITVERTIPVKNLHILHGYFLILDKDGYSVLDELGVKE